MDKSLLFIILLVLWLVFNFFKASKKKQEPKKAPTEGEQESPDVNEMFNRFLGGQQYQPVEQTSPPEPDFVANSGRQDYETFDDDIPLTEEYGSQESLNPWGEENEREKSMNDKNKESRIMDNKDQAYYEIVEEENFDLKTAIIYSTILDKPY